MNKPNNFDNVRTGDFTPITPGGHHMIIKGVEERKTKTGKDMLVVAFDFAPNDKQPSYAAQLFNSDIRPDKKWPNSCITYVVAVDNDGNTSRNFKTFIKSVEDSNKGFITTWGEGQVFTQQFKGKRVGGVFGRVEEEYNGERKIRTILRWFCSDSRVDNANVPADKLLGVSAAPAQVTTSSTIPAGFTPVQDDDIPF